MRTPLAAASAAQVRLIWLADAAVATRLVGALGHVVASAIADAAETPPALTA